VCRVAISTSSRNAEPRAAAHVPKRSVTTLAAGHRALDDPQRRGRIIYLSSAAGVQSNAGGAAYGGAKAAIDIRPTSCTKNSPTTASGRSP
jgi:NAD(P)-dependent dehydrogenase (short-subunit alcohol dehydrogenase family)